MNTDFVIALLQGISSEVMISTGANIPLINEGEFNRIKDQGNEDIPTINIFITQLMTTTSQLP